MSYQRGTDRQEVQLLPACIDDYIPANASARFIDAYAEGLNFVALGFSHAEVKATGRPPYHPADLLKLYLYGYLHRIRSSRRLEAEASRNLEVIWLLKGLRPDFKTIADFRKNNRDAFKPLFKHFNLLCRNLGLFGAELVAIDGSKFKADNNLRRHFSREQLTELIQKVEKRIEEYLGELDQLDTEAAGTETKPNRQELEQKIKQLKEHKGECDELLNSFSADQTQISLTDPDCRKLKGPKGDLLLGYNVQVAVDAKHDLIVAEEVVLAANDLGQLSGMALAAQEQLEVKSLQIVADKGYHDGNQLEVCEKAGMETFVPEQGRTSGRGPNGEAVFPKERFIYDAAADAYKCPAGQSLGRSHESQSRGRGRIHYSNRAACEGCPLRAQCTTSAFRKIGRRPNEEVVERAAERTRGRADLVARRKTIVEHVFGTLRQWNHDRFLTRGLGKVRGEFSLSALVYNLRRALNLRSVEELIGALSLQAKPATVPG